MTCFAMTVLLKLKRNFRLKEGGNMMRITITFGRVRITIYIKNNCHKLVTPAVIQKSFLLIPIYYKSKDFSICKHTFPHSVQAMWIF